MHGESEWVRASCACYVLPALLRAEALWCAACLLVVVVVVVVVVVLFLLMRLVRMFFSIAGRPAVNMTAAALRRQKHHDSRNRDQPTLYAVCVCV